MMGVHILHKRPTCNYLQSQCFPSLSDNVGTFASDMHSQTFVLTKKLAWQLRIGGVSIDSPGLAKNVAFRPASRRKIIFVSCAPDYDMIGNIAAPRAKSEHRAGVSRQMERGSLCEVRD